MLAVLPAWGQTEAGRKDSLSQTLPEAVVVGFGQNAALRKTAAPIGVLDARVLNRFSQASLTQALNTLPGVRMEERATASYRLSLRGSTLRSPFGVRNVKVYYQGIPLTDAGGTTPLNWIDPGQLGRVEVIKGPTSSIYGAGTGGSVLLENQSPKTQASLLAGSYGLKRYTASLGGSRGRAQGAVYLARQELGGYRANSGMRRNVLAADGRLTLDRKARHQVEVHGLLTYLDYQIPGALTKAQYEANPRQARPGLEALRAGYETTAGLLGLGYRYEGSKLRLSSTVYGSAATIVTPFVTDYERNRSLGLGTRTALRWQVHNRVSVQVGAEGQIGADRNRSYQNLGGQAGPLRYSDRIRPVTAFVFAQTDIDLTTHLRLTLGASYTGMRYRIRRGSAATVGVPGTVRYAATAFSPRLALLWSRNERLTVYATASQGFSPPTVDEIRPSDGSLNTGLRPELGTNYELGLRGTLGRIRYDVSAYRFALSQAIGSYTDSSGVTLFRNQGSTTQPGLEASLSLQLGEAAGTGARLWGAYAWQPYKRNGSRPFPGVSEHTLSAGADLSLAGGFYLSPTLSLQSSIPLNDDASVRASAYTVWSARAGWRGKLARYPLDLYVGADNATDRRYSLGNDLNAFGGRYYQPAPGRGFYGGLSVQL